MTLPAVNLTSMLPGLSPTSVSGTTNTASSSGDFAKTLANAVDQTNNALQSADNMASTYAAGGPVSLDQLMIAEQQASLSLDLVVQVRDRAVSAYQSIMNMQI